MTDHPKSPPPPPPLQGDYLVEILSAFSTQMQSTPAVCSVFLLTAFADRLHKALCVLMPPLLQCIDHCCEIVIAAPSGFSSIFFVFFGVSQCAFQMFFQRRLTLTLL